MALTDYVHPLEIVGWSLGLLILLAVYAGASYPRGLITVVVGPLVVLGIYLRQRD